MENNSPYSNDDLNNINFDTSKYSFVGGGRSCTASGYYASIVTGVSNTVIGSASGVVGTSAFGDIISTMDNYFKDISLLEDKESYIVKYYPEKSKWKIYNQGSMIIADTIGMINCVSESKLFNYQEKQVGVFMVRAKELQKKENDNYNLIY